jgi:RNA polymerase sigma-70 factor (ECF subfamily)
MQCDYLFNYAMKRLRDLTDAEDVVQETFLATLKGGKIFAGRSVERSWLVGILKNKICDHYRRASRETRFTDLEFYSDEESGRFVAEGLRKGAWIHELGPREWPNPRESLDNEEFWQTYRDCSGKLPKNIAAVFNLREVDDLDSKRICHTAVVLNGRVERRRERFRPMASCVSALSSIVANGHQVLPTVCIFAHILQPFAGLWILRGAAVNPNLQIMAREPRSLPCPSTINS